MSLLVSVVVPVYNAESILTDTMGNLIYQSIYERYGEGSCEILLIDDCSTDSTPYILDDLQRQFPNRIRVFHLPENLGPGGARNKGMDEARGQYVGFVNCDLVARSFFCRLDLVKRFDFVNLDVRWLVNLFDGCVGIVEPHGDSSHGASLRLVRLMRAFRQGPSIPCWHDCPIMRIAMCSIIR